MTYKTRQPFPHAAYVEGQRNFTYFDRSLTSGLTDEIISSPGDFLYIDQASTGVVSVELNMRQGGTLAPILLAAGGSIECDFASIKLNATAQLNKTARIVVGNGARIKGGANVNASSMNVSVLDGGLVRTLANKAFSGAYNFTSAAGEYPILQLSNPVGSGKNLFLEKIRIATSSASNSGLIAVRAAGAGASAGATWVSNKYAGGSVGVGDIRYLSSAATGATSYLSYDLLTAAMPVEYNYVEPIVIPPGKGIIAYCGAYASMISANFEWYEE